MKLFNNTFDLLEKSMDLQFRRHTLLSGNVANSETPNYRARDLDFANELQKAVGHGSEDELQKTNALHMDSTELSQAHAVFDNSGAMGGDGNNVDLDVSMAKIADNSRGYSNATSWLGVQLRLLKTAARGRIGA